MELVKKLLRGDEKSAARLISMIEEGRDEGHRAISLIFPHTGKAHTIGITGAPGAGKSTLINRLAVSFVNQGKTVGIIAVDPTSMKGNGALLGDRLRMRDAEKIDGVFIRSMAHRGYPGGIAKATVGAVYVLDALGKEIVMVETVGAGQSEIQISSLCSTVITLLTPDFGDEIQLMKAGLIEIGDIVAINKTGRVDAEVVAMDVAAHVRQRKGDDWETPVLTVQAIKGEGIDKLIDAVNRHSAYLRENAYEESRKKEKLKTLMLALLKEETWSSLLGNLERDADFKNALCGVQNNKVDVYSAVQEVLGKIFRGHNASGSKQGT